MFHAQLYELLPSWIESRGVFLKSMLRCSRVRIQVTILIRHLRSPKFGVIHNYTIISTVSYFCEVLSLHGRHSCPRPNACPIFRKLSAKVSCSFTCHSYEFLIFVPYSVRHKRMLSNFCWLTASNWAGISLVCACDIDLRDAQLKSWTDSPLFEVWRTKRPKTGRPSAEGLTQWNLDFWVGIWIGLESVPRAIGFCDV